MKEKAVKKNNNSFSAYILSKQSNTQRNFISVLILIICNKKTTEQKTVK